MNALLERFRSYPPALRWLLIGLAVVAGFLAWQDFVWKSATVLGERAEAYQQAIAKAESDSRRLNDTTASAILTMGETEPLRDRESSTESAVAAIIDVVNKYSVSGLEVKPKTPMGMKPSEMHSILGGRSGVRVIVEVRFETTQENAFGVIADLEAHPAIESLSKVRLSRVLNAMRPGKTIVVQLTAEAWAFDALDAGGPIGGNDA